MPDSLHPAALPVDDLLADCLFERTKRGGPGGQHRNKTESAIVVTHRTTGVCGQASERRSQHANRDVAIERLRLNLALAIRQPAERDSLEPSERWQARTRGGKISVSTRHSDYPALLAEAMDALEAFAYEVPEAAARLKVSNSQLLKFLKTTPAALDWLNQNRQHAGMRPLK